MKNFIWLGCLLVVSLSSAVLGAAQPDDLGISPRQIGQYQASVWYTIAEFEPDSVGALLQTCRAAHRGILMSVANLLGDEPAKAFTENPNRISFNLGVRPPVDTILSQPWYMFVG